MAENRNKIEYDGITYIDKTNGRGKYFALHCGKRKGTTQRCFEVRQSLERDLEAAADFGYYNKSRAIHAQTLCQRILEAQQELKFYDDSDYVTRTTAGRKLLHDCNSSLREDKGIQSKKNKFVMLDCNIRSKKAGYVKIGSNTDFKCVVIDLLDMDMTTVDKKYLESHDFLSKGGVDGIKFDSSGKVLSIYTSNNAGYLSSKDFVVKWVQAVKGGVYCNITVYRKRPVEPFTIKTPCVAGNLNWTFSLGTQTVDKFELKCGLVDTNNKIKWLKSPEFALSTNTTTLHRPFSKYIY